MCRISINTSVVTNFLMNTDKIYLHFVLLDHMDWMYLDRKTLFDQWKEIICHSKRGTKILIRSVGKSEWMVSDFVRQHFDFDQRKRLVDLQHRKDRVCTYGSPHLGKRMTEADERKRFDLWQSST